MLHPATRKRFPLTPDSLSLLSHQAAGQNPSHRPPRCTLHPPCLSAPTPSRSPSHAPLLPGLTEELLDCSGGAEISLESGTARKLDALGRSLSQHGARRAIVFCNKIEACRTVENFLNRKDRVGEKYT